MNRKSSHLAAAMLLVLAAGCGDLACRQDHRQASIPTPARRRRRLWLRRRRDRPRPPKAKIFTGPGPSIATRVVDSRSENIARPDVGFLAKALLGKRQLLFRRVSMLLRQGCSAD